MSACPTCGASQPSAAGFCGRCGEDLLSDPAVNTPGKSPRGSETSRAAALRVAPRTGTQRSRVLSLIADAYPGGLADEQVRQATGFDIRACSARRKELEEGGWVERSSMTWLAPSGNHVAVWVLTAEGLARQ